MKSKRVKRGMAILAIVLVILGVVFFCLRLHRDPQLVGTWQRVDGEWEYTRIFHADRSGSIETDVPSITWRTGSGRLIVTSMSVDRHYEYSVSEDGEKLILVSTGHSRMYIRVRE